MQLLASRATLALVVTALFVATASGAFAHSGDGTFAHPGDGTHWGGHADGHMSGDGHMWGGNGMGIGGTSLVGLVWLGLLVAVPAGVAYYALTRRDADEDEPDAAVRTLRERYARGELDADEYEEKRARLSEVGRDSPRL